MSNANLAAGDRANRQDATRTTTNLCDTEEYSCAEKYTINAVIIVNRNAYLIWKMPLTIPARFAEHQHLMCNLKYDIAQTLLD